MKVLNYLCLFFIVLAFKSHADIDLTVADSIPGGKIFIFDPEETIFNIPESEVISDGMEIGKDDITFNIYGSILSLGLDSRRDIEALSVYYLHNVDFNILSSGQINNFSDGVSVFGF